MAFVFVDTNAFLDYLFNPLFEQDFSWLLKKFEVKKPNARSIAKRFFGPSVERLEKLKTSVYKRTLNLLLPEVIVSEIYRKVEDKLLELKDHLAVTLDNSSLNKDKEYFLTKRALLDIIEKQIDGYKQCLEGIFLHPTVFALDWTDAADKNARKRVANRVPPFSTNPKKQKAERINDCIAFESILECLHGIFIESKDGKKEDCDLFIVTRDMDYGRQGELHSEIQRDLRQFAATLELRDDFNKLLDSLVDRGDSSPNEDRNFCRACRIHAKPYLAVFSSHKFKCSTCEKVFMEHDNNVLYGVGLVCPFCYVLTPYDSLQIAE